MIRLTRLRLQIASETALRFLSSKSVNDKSNLDGRVAIVTAGTNGIGFAIAKRLAGNGAAVVVSSRKQSNVDRAVDELTSHGLKVSGIACHFGKEDERENLLKETVSKHGAVNILVQNAGVNPHPHGILNTPESVIDKTCNLHIKSNFRMIQQIVPYMAQSKHQGSIVLTSTMVAYQGHMLPGAYSVTKSAIIAMPRAFVNDLCALNIRINCMTIGCVETSFFNGAMKKKEVRDNFLQLQPMGRFGTADECAGLAAYLASDDSSYVTGENFSITGGAFTRF